MSFFVSECNLVSSSKYSLWFSKGNPIARVNDHMVMAHKFDPTLDKGKQLSAYRDQRFHGSLREQEDALKHATTLYIGNLSYYTREEQVYELFGRAGDVRRVIMGLDRYKKTPCGFCFVEYYTREDAEIAIRTINGTRLDERVIRTDWDVGFIEGRQYGRGKHGGQVRDEYRKDYDPGRGGWSKMVQARTDNLEE